MNRRKFVAGAGLLAGVSVVGMGVRSLTSTDSPAQAPHSFSALAKVPGPAGRIDVHHNIVPPAWVEAVDKLGLGGARLPVWSVDQSLALMNQNGIQTALTSVPAPGVAVGGAALARRCNEFAAEMAVAHPGRFGSFAALPLPATEQACAEAIYALDTLHADGITLLGSNDGVFLGDPQFDELMAELDRRQATVLVQPNLHASSVQLGLGTPPFMLELGCDTTRAALNLVFTGALERFPRINWILAHGGGFLPYAAWRVSLANALPEFGDLVPQGVMTYVRRFYFDTALSCAAPTMAVLKELVEPSQLLFGSGFPSAGNALVTEQIAMLNASPLWRADERRGIERTHALALFSRYQAAGDAVELAPVHGHESTGQWLGRMVKKPFGAVAQHLKD